MTAPLIQGASGIEGENLTYASTNENNKEIYTFTANEPVSWSISGGEQNLFTIDENTGKLSFKDAPDYETIKQLNGTTLEFHTNYSTTIVGSKFFVEIYNDQNQTNKTTPITANNFIEYVSDGSYNQTLIHRLVSNFVIQGGGYTWPSFSSNESGGYPIGVKSKGEIINEPINSNLMGTIAMAKVSGQPNSATSEWFLNLSDNTHLNSQNEGFSVFGHLLGDSIKNPLLLNNQTIYNVHYSDAGLTIPELPLNNLEGNIINNANYFAIRTISTITQRPSEIENVFNVIVTANDLNGNKSNQYVIVNVNDIKGEVLNGIDGQDNLKGGLGNDVFQGNSGNDTIDGGADYDIATYSGNFSDYTFAIANKIVTVTDNRSSTNDGIDTLSNIEKLVFSNQNALVTSKEIKAIHSLGFQSEKVYSGKSDNYKFYDLGNDNYGVGTANGIDELTGESILRFDDKNMNLKTDIKATFDQVTGLDTDSGKMFRLYNASFKRLPDPDGLRYWIENFSSGKDDERAVASSFLASAEFKERYGENVSNASYVNTLYVNVLGRDYDQAGYNYWLGNLNNGIETRYELLLGFSESAENKGLFSEMTGLV
ncbi:DUF4214 domain-containing protein [Prochlorococcus marinus]|uniref:DUF4214 domain-containing protein n=1 Tax=Prochlorococcus marinus TaxID=1219 RepID=UPI0022B3FA0B|nr:DUF4214 domain-containing protein [Prochlorococcus marinus]